jgi:hypothetical protein
MAFSENPRTNASGADPQLSRAELLTVLRWFLAVWVLGGVALASWFAIPYVTDPENPLRYELLIGIFIGVVVGIPAAIAKPFLVAFSWATLSWPVRAAQLLPVVLLALVTASLSFGGTI